MVINFATWCDWILKLLRASGAWLRRKIVSSLERFDFSLRISSVMKGLRGLEGQVTVLRGACLSNIAESVVLKRFR